jgi:MFS family permease
VGDGATCLLSGFHPAFDKELVLAGPRPRAWLIFAVVALALFMSTLDGTIVVIAIPTMLRELDTNLAWLAWTLTGYTLAQTIIMPVSGKLSDELGRKRLFLVAAVLFTVGSIASGLAPNVYVLILFRVVQGILVAASFCRWRPGS